METEGTKWKNTRERKTWWDCVKDDMKSFGSSVKKLRIKMTGEGESRGAIFQGENLPVCLDVCGLQGISTLCILWHRQSQWPVTTNITAMVIRKKYNSKQLHTCISLAISRSSRLRFLRMSLRRLSLCFNSTESRRCCDIRFTRSSDVSCLRWRLRSMRSWRSMVSSRLFITCMHAAILSSQQHSINQ